MKSLERRVDRLENEAGGKGRILVAVLYPGDSEEDAIKRAGIEPTDDNLVVLVRRFSVQAEGELKCQAI